MMLEAGDRLVFTGDSITDSGRARPIGRSPWGLGTGYVRDVAASLGALHPERPLTIFNTGVSGDTVRDLAARWQEDVTPLRPDWLAIMIGINDVWRQFDTPGDPSAGVSPADYAEMLEGLIASVRPALKGLFVMPPFFIEPNRHEPVRSRMDAYGAISRDVCDRQGGVFVDVQAAFDRMCDALHPMAIASDRVHPGPAGHMAIALTFLDAVRG